MGYRRRRRRATALLTVPADRSFVLVGGMAATGGNSGQDLELYEDATLRAGFGWLGQYGFWAGNLGNVRFVFPPGSDVILTHNGSSTCHYYFEGYLAHP